MSTGTTQTVSKALGVTFTTAQSVTTTGGEIRNPTIGAAVAGSLTTRTDNNTGTLTMGTGHGITTAARLDIYWTNTDGTIGTRYGMTVGSVSGNSVPIDLGGGDNLPPLNTAVTAMIPQEAEFTVTAADLEFLGASAPDLAQVVWTDGSDAAVKNVVIESSTDAYQWISTSGITNPFGSTDVAKVYMSRGTASGTGQVIAVALDDDAS